MPSRKRRVWWDEGKAAGFLTWAGGFAVSRVACEFCARSNCVNANRDIRLFPRSKKLHAYLPLPLLAADVGCCAGTWPRLGTVSVPSFWRAIHNRSSGIGRCSRARSPNGQLGGNWASTYAPVGAFLLAERRPKKKRREVFGFPTIPPHLKT